MYNNYSYLKHGINALVCSCSQNLQEMAMVGACNSFKGGNTTILDIAVDCLRPSARLSQQLLKPINVSSYIGHAVSVQDSSGAILGCGQLESHFPVYASYREEIVFQQYSQYHQTYSVSWASEDFEVFEYSILEGVGDTCPSKAAIFDPWKPPPEQVDSWNTTDLYPVGDLSNRQMYYREIDVPLIGNATILGHVVCTDHGIKCIVISN